MRYRPHEFAEIAGVTVKTLQRWDNSGKLYAKRTIGNHRYYTDEHLRQLKGITKVTKKKVIYCRVSSSAQKSELKNQVEAMTSFCTANGVIIDKVIEEIGGCLNFKRQKFLGLLTEILTGKVEVLYIAHKDRLCRFAFDLIEHIATINGCSIVVVNNNTLSPQQEVVEDLMAIIHGFSCRLYGSRSYKEFFKKNLDKNLDKKLRYKSDEIQC